MMLNGLSRSSWESIPIGRSYVFEKGNETGRSAPNLEMNVVTKGALYVSQGLMRKGSLSWQC